MMIAKILVRNCLGRRCLGIIVVSGFIAFNLMLISEFENTDTNKTQDDQDDNEELDNKIHLREVFQRIHEKTDISRNRQQLPDSTTLPNLQPTKRAKSDDLDLNIDVEFEEYSRGNKSFRSRSRSNVTNRHEIFPKVWTSVSSPGEQGKGVSFDNIQLSSQEQSEYNEGIENNDFNQFLSDRISLHRSLPDNRNTE